MSVPALRRFGLAAAVASIVGVAGMATDAQPVPEPAGYHGEPYRSPVPATLAGAGVIGDDEAVALHQGGTAVFVDVLPRDEKPADLPEGTVWIDRPHDTIPGAIWLPNTGYEALASSVQEYFAAGLSAATGSDLTRPVVFFCRAECWMSWNAAKRALEMGYKEVIWYPDGVDGWAAAGKPFVRVEPFPAP